MYVFDMLTKCPEIVKTAQQQMFWNLFLGNKLKELSKYQLKLYAWGTKLSFIIIFML